VESMKNDRYQRQRLVLEFGDNAQDVLRKKKVVIIGGGGLGSHSAEILVRMGIGAVDIIDNDTVHVTNLHRTAIFTEKDVDKQKAIVLQERLTLINSDVTVHGINKKVTNETIEPLIKNADIILDGTDNMETRFLINETAIKHNVPWVYAGVYGTMGMVLGIIPAKTPCFTCMAQSIPEKTSETPVLGNLPQTIASIQCTEAIKILIGKPVEGLIIFDLWSHRFEQVKLQRNAECSCCGKRLFTWLDKE
jgi:molybdopterin-synthase adenylyltransferase